MIRAKTLLIGIIILLFSCSKEESSDTLETAHFVIKVDKDKATPTEIEETKLFAERIFEAYNAYFGEDKIPNQKTIINLGGDAFTGNGEPRIPFVNEQGEIFLYRFATGYLGELPHEYVHVIRLFNGWSSDGFLEEGLAETISSRLFPENIGFSLYGYSTTIAASYWLQDDSLIPLNDLKERHFELNLKCLPQSYGLRADFFNFLLEEFGKQAFFDFIYGSDAGSYEEYERIFEQTFVALEQEWLQNLIMRSEATENIDAQITAYAQKIGELNFYVCKINRDF